MLPECSPKIEISKPFIFGHVITIMPFLDKTDLQSRIKSFGENKIRSGKTAFVQCGHCLGGY